MSELDDDIERLAGIGDQVLAGTPIESFGLGDAEIHFVVAYCKRGVDGMLGPIQAATNTDAIKLRKFLLSRYETDYSLSDEALAAAAEEAKAFIGRRRWSWLVIAGERLTVANTPKGGSDG